MMKPVPDEFYDEDQKLMRLVLATGAYDDIEDVVRKNASKEYREWFFESQKHREELEKKGIV